MSSLMPDYEEERKMVRQLWTIMGDSSVVLTLNARYVLTLILDLEKPLPSNATIEPDLIFTLEKYLDHYDHRLKMNDHQKI